MPLFRRKPEADAPPPADRPAADAGAFLPRRGRRSRGESAFMRLVATGGIVGIGAAIAAGVAAGDGSGWLIGIVVSRVSVIMAPLLWSSRTLWRIFPQR